MQTKSNIIERYTLAEPIYARIDYTKLFSNKTVPVMYNNKTTHGTTMYEWVSMNTFFVHTYLSKLYKIPLNVVLGHKKRTIHIINLENGKQLYILPNLDNMENPIMMYDKDIAFNVTPEINKAIVQAKQFYTR